MRPLGDAMRPSLPSPRQMWSSEPQMLARVMRTVTPPGSGSGTGSSRMTNGSFGP